MHSILENFFDDNSFFKILIEKDKIKFCESYVSYEKNIFLLIKILGFVINALSTYKNIRDY